MKKVFDFLLELPTLIMEITFIGLIMLLIWGGAKADAVKENCYYKDMQACKVVYEMGGLTELSKVIGGDYK